MGLKILLFSPYKQENPPRYSWESLMSSLCSIERVPVHMVHALRNVNQLSTTWWGHKSQRTPWPSEHRCAICLFIVFYSVWYWGFPGEPAVGGRHPHCATLIFNNLMVLRSLSSIYPLWEVIHTPGKYEMLWYCRGIREKESWSLQGHSHTFTLSRVKWVQHIF